MFEIMSKLKKYIPKLKLNCPKCGKRVSASEAFRYYGLDRACHYAKDLPKDRQTY